MENEFYHLRNVRVNFTTKRSTSKALVVAFLLTLLMGGLFAVMMLIKQGTELRSKASGTGPVLSILPATKSLPVGQQFTFSVSIDTKDDTVSAVQLDILFDTEALENVVFTPGSILPVILKPASLVGGNKIRVSLGVDPEHPFKGTGVLGTLQVRGKSANQSTISFTSNTQTASLSKPTNSLGGSQASTVTVTSDSSPTNTPTHTPQPSRTPTPGPSSTPTPGDDDEDETPSPTPTKTGNVFQNWWNNRFGPSPTPTPPPEPTPLPEGSTIAGYAIINDMCFPLAEQPQEEMLYPSLAECIGALNIQIQQSGTTAPTMTPTPTPKTPRVPFFVRFFAIISEAFSRLFKFGNQ